MIVLFSLCFILLSLLIYTLDFSSTVNLVKKEKWSFKKELTINIKVIAQLFLGSEKERIEYPLALRFVVLLSCCVLAVLFIPFQGETIFSYLFHREIDRNFFFEYVIIIMSLLSLSFNSNHSSEHIFNQVEKKLYSFVIMIILFLCSFPEIHQLETMGLFKRPLLLMAYIIFFATIFNEKIKNRRSKTFILKSVSNTNIKCVWLIYIALTFFNFETIEIPLEPIVLQLIIMIFLNRLIIAMQKYGFNTLVNYKKVYINIIIPLIVLDLGFWAFYEYYRY